MKMFVSRSFLSSFNITIGKCFYYNLTVFYLAIIIRIDESIPLDNESDLIKNIIITKDEQSQNCNLILAKISCKSNKLIDFEGSLFIHYSSSIIEGKGTVVVCITPLGYFETERHFSNSYTSKNWIDKSELEESQNIKNLQLSMEDELFTQVKGIIAYCLNSLLDASIILDREGDKNYYNLIVKSKVASLLRGFFAKDKLFHAFLRNFVVNNLNHGNSEITSSFSEDKVIVRLSTVEPIKWNIDKYE